MFQTSQELLVLQMRTIAIIKTREKEFQENQARQDKVAVLQLQEILFVQMLRELAETMQTEVLDLVS
ncbi:hypothetical protein D3C80_1589070 [compost metagenome]